MDGTAGADGAVATFVTTGVAVGIGDGGEARAGLDGILAAAGAAGLAAARAGVTASIFALAGEGAAGAVATAGAPLT